MAEAAEKVSLKLKTFTPSGLFAQMYKTDKDNSFFHSFAVGALNGLTNSYNQLNELSNGLNNLSNEGKALLDKVKGLLSGPSASKFEEIGLKLDKYSGAIVFDETVFGEKIASDPQTVRSILLDANMLGPVLQETMATVLAKPATAYFTSSFSVNV
ncbi:MAG: hypothetical protein E6X17_01205 [Sporomusaceae bacterium]|nr:hypothetical protein [Sporomusaceae bacterium]